MSSIFNRFQLFISRPYTYDDDMCVYANEGRLAISFILLNLKRVARFKRNYRRGARNIGDCAAFTGRD